MTTSTESSKQGAGLSLALLRRYHFGELSEAETARVEAALADDAEATARLERMRGEEAAFLDRVDVVAESVAIVERMDRALERPTIGDRIRSLLTARPMQAVLALVVLVALVPIGRNLMMPAEHSGNRIKGNAEIRMFVKDGGGYREGGDGERLSEGDQIQFRYKAVGHRYVFVVSIDSRGTVSPLYPDVPSRSIEVRPEGVNTLEGSVILDDVVGPERIFAVFSDEPIAFDQIEGSLPKSERDVTALQKIDLGREDVRQATILIIKE